MAIPLVQNKDTGLVVRSIINELVNYANNSTVTGSFKVTGSSDITGDLRVDGSTYFTGSVYISGSNTLFNTGPATFSGSLTQGMGPFFVSKYFAKQSALITVKELIRCAPYGLYDSLTGEPDPDTVEYFWIVKEELEKI